MVKSKLRYYTYKITFRDLPKYFYYGKHKDNGRPYFGTPKTWKHLWDQFEPEIQILQWYNSWEEVSRAEDSIIRETWGSPYSLNENVGGIFSERVLEESIKKMLSHPNTVRSRKENGKKVVEEGLGIYNPEYQESGVCKQVLSENGKRNGKRNGKKNGKRNGKRTSTPVLCLETGRRYSSLCEAQLLTGVNNGNISQCCRGKRKQAGGFSWQYTN